MSAAIQTEFKDNSTGDSNFGDVGDVTFLDKDMIDMFTCGICLEPVRDAHRSCSSDHFFCFECLQSVSPTFEEKNEFDDDARLRCPMCRDTMFVDEESNKVGKPAPFVDRMVQLAWVQCENEGCGKKLKFKDLAIHKSQCDHEIIECMYKWAWCNHKCKRSEMAQHMYEDGERHTCMHLSDTSNKFCKIADGYSYLSNSIKTGCKEIADANGKNFDEVKTRLSHLEDTVNKIGEVMDTLSSSMLFLVEQHTMHSSASKESAIEGEKIKKRLIQSSGDKEGCDSFTPPSKKQHASPKAPGAPGPANRHGRRVNAFYAF